ncbi:MAG: helix-turn-helix domain-containing protein [Deferribacterales bacterium]
MSDLLLKMGLKIRELRKKRGLSQEKLAVKANISSKYIGEIERGEVNISVAVLLEIADALGVSCDELMETDHIADKAELVNKIHDFIKKADEENIKKVYLFIKNFC